MKRTKIVATIGPASESEEMLVAMAQAGVNVFRLNFSHGTHEEHLERIKKIREINEKYNFNIAILQDLQGPKIRVGEMEGGNDGVMLVAGEPFVFTAEQVVGNSQRASTPYEGMDQDVKIGDRILMDDGKLEVKVTKIDKENHEVHTEVIYGGLLKQRKGVNLPNTNISQPSVTAKDYEDLDFGLENDVDWIALSFVRTAREIYAVKQYIRSKGSDAKLIAKMEKPEAIINMDEIIEASDGIMVARGDLGVEIPAEEVPTVQKTMIKKCQLAVKPVIVATQMLESMMESPSPTRAEVGDVANAVLDGADAVMLSGESAAGKYPLLAVETMAKTIEHVEEYGDPALLYYQHHTRVTLPDYESNMKDNDNVIMMGCRLARDLRVKAIVAISTSGYTAFRLSHHRPQAQIFVGTDNDKLLNQLSLYWGVNAFSTNKLKNPTNELTLIDQANRYLQKKNYLVPGDKFINMLSHPIGRQHRTNNLILNTYREL